MDYKLSYSGCLSRPYKPDMFQMVQYLLETFFETYSKAMIFKSKILGSAEIISSESEVVVGNSINVEGTKQNAPVKLERYPVVSCLWTVVFSPHWLLKTSNFYWLILSIIVDCEKL